MKIYGCICMMFVYFLVGCCSVRISIVIYYCSVYIACPQLFILGAMAVWFICVLFNCFGWLRNSILEIVVLYIVSFLLVLFLAFGMLVRTVINFEVLLRNNIFWERLLFCFVTHAKIVQILYNMRCICQLQMVLVSELMLAVFKLVILA